MSETRFIGGVEVTPQYYDPHGIAGGPLWLTDGGGIGIGPLNHPGDWWEIIHHPGNGQEVVAPAAHRWDEGQRFPNEVLYEITRYQYPDYRGAEAAAAGAAELVDRLREMTAPDSGLQVMAGQWHGWPRGNPADGLKW